MAEPNLAGMPVELKRQILKNPVSATFPGRESGLDPAIIRVSKAFAIEGLDILYRGNIFYFKTLRTLNCFCSAINRYSRGMQFNNIHRVKHICLGVGGEFLDHLVAGNFRSHFPNLVKVDLNRWYADLYQSPTKDLCEAYFLRRIEEELANRMREVVVRVVDFEE